MTYLASSFWPWPTSSSSTPHSLSSLDCAEDGDWAQGIRNITTMGTTPMLPTCLQLTMELQSSVVTTSSSRGWIQREEATFLCWADLNKYCWSHRIRKNMRKKENLRWGMQTQFTHVRNLQFSGNLSFWLCLDGLRMLVAYLTDTIGLVTNRRVSCKHTQFWGTSKITWFWRVIRSASVGQLCTQSGSAKWKHFP